MSFGMKFIIKDMGRKVAWMARAPNKKAEEARALYKKGMKLVDIATKLDKCQ